MINAHFIAHEITNNAQSTVHYLLLIVCIILASVLLDISFTPKHLKLNACGMPSRDFVNNPLEGYRTLVPNKITLNTPSSKPNFRQGWMGIER